MFPILEFDPKRKAYINPRDVVEKANVPKHCVICFFQDVIEHVASDFKATVLAQNVWEDGPHPLYEINFTGERLAFMHPGVGAPLAAGLLEEIIALGCKKFIAVGGCGALVKNMELGKLVVVNAAIRDEGVSYHYLPPSREVEAQPKVVSVIENVLTEKDIPYLLGKTWTTSAPYRETKWKINDRVEAGCLTVEMEAAAMMAVAQFRKAAFGQILYAGDDLSGETWDNRDWQSEFDIRYQLFWLAVASCLKL